MSEEMKKAIENGENVELDGITIINGLSVGEIEKKEETKEEPVEQEQAITSEVEVTPVQEEANVDPISAITSDLSSINSVAPEVPSYGMDDVVISPVNPTVEVPSEPVMPVNTDLFSKTYDEEEKVIGTVVTEDDEEKARSANLEAYANLYDRGPGMQINILRKFSERAADWIKKVNDYGFVSGEMHDVAKIILNEYKGLKSESISDTYSDIQTEDNKIISMEQETTTKDMAA